MLDVAIVEQLRQHGSTQFPRRCPFVHSPFLVQRQTGLSVTHGGYLDDTLWRARVTRRTITEHPRMGAEMQLHTRAPRFWQGTHM